MHPLCLCFLPTPTPPPPGKIPPQNGKIQLLCTPEQQICVFPIHFSSLEVRESASKAPPTLWKEKRTFSESPFWARHCISCFRYSIVLILPTRQFAWSTCCERLLGRRLLCLSFPSADLVGPIFPNLEFFVHINMDKVLLWTVHSSRNDRCQIKLQNSPTLHSLHSPPINKRILVLLSRKTLLIMAFLSNARELLLPALQSLHYFAHTLLTPDGKQYSVFKCDYLNSSRNSWGISEWPPVLNWTSPCYRNGLLWIPKNSYSFSLCWDKLQCDPSLASSMLWALCLQTKWRQNHKYVPRRNTRRLFLPLFSNTAKSLLWSWSSLLYSFAPTSSLSMGSWKSLFSLLSPIYFSVTA